MKTISTILLFLAVVSFRPQSESKATPRKIQGIDVYVYSEPTRPYEIIETKTKALKLQCDDMLIGPIKSAAKVEGAQGVIIYWPETQKYSVIKYKD